MTIKKIKIEKVKGIDVLELDLEILPNKPSLLVAPNGFGKSSITAAFSSLTPSKLKLDKNFLHKADDLHKAKLTLTIERSDGTIDTVTADENQNLISQTIDVFVINSRLEAKAIKHNMGGFTSASASLEINEVALIDKIPNRSKFEYNITTLKKQFGENGKILGSIELLLSNYLFTNELCRHTDVIAKFSGSKNQKKLTDILSKINNQNGSADSIRVWIGTNLLDEFDEIDCLKAVAEVILSINTVALNQTEAYLIAYQICWLYSHNSKLFKEACAYNAYLFDKEIFTDLIASFDTTWKTVKPKEHKGKLIVEFPKAFHISNGQRDSLCFAALMQRAKKKLGKRDCILVIDEVFDYLDDANLTAVQYYVSNLIEEIKQSGKRIYPLIFTHLNPIYFKNYAFSKQKVYFLDKRLPVISEQFKKLILNREELSIKAGVDKHHLHFEPNSIDLQAEFKILGLKETWGKSNIFHAHLLSEWEKYKKNQDDYDPFAICCYIRVQIEKQIYIKIIDPVHQQKFVDTHGTKSKLNYATSIGIEVSEVCYLLGVIYNEGMHIKSNIDYASPIVSKLENLIIRKMAYQATNTI